MLNDLNDEIAKLVHALHVQVITKINTKAKTQEEADLALQYYYKVVLVTCAIQQSLKDEKGNIDDVKSLEKLTKMLRILNED
jgi:hypothetical protein